MTRRGATTQREEQQQRQPDELDPARNLDPRRRPAGASRHPIVPPRVERPPPPRVGLVVRRGRGARARPSRRLGEPRPSRADRRHDSRLKARRGSDTVLPMSPPLAPGRAVRLPGAAGQNESAGGASSRSSSRSRSSRSCTLLVTAFGGGDHPARARRAGERSRLLPAGPPAPQVIARLGTLHLQLPVNQSRVTAIGYSAAPTARSRSRPSARRRTRACSSALVHAVVGGGSRRAALVPAPRRRRARRPRRSTSARRPGPTSTRRSTARSSGSSKVVARTAGRSASGSTSSRRSAPSLVVSVSHVAADPSLVGRRLRDRVGLEARRRCSTSRRSRRRRSRATRTTRATTC